MTRIRTYTWFIVSSVALGCASLGPFGSRPLRVMSYNIHAGWDPAGESNLERVAAIIRASNADVVLLQEVDRFTTRSGRVDQVARLRELTKMRSAFGKTLDYQGGEYGIAILSRWPVISDTLIHLPVSPPQQRAGGSYEPRGVLHAAIAAPFGRLDVYNTHLDASTDDTYRIQEIAAVLAAAAAGTSRFVVIGGDLNATPESAVLRATRAAGRRDSWQECGKGPDATYPDVAPVKRIDYVLLTDAFRCRTARVLDQRASDHRPVLVTLDPVR